MQPPHRILLTWGFAYGAAAANATKSIIRNVGSCMVWSETADGIGSRNKCCCGSQTKNMKGDEAEEDQMVRYLLYPNLLPGAVQCPLGWRGRIYIFHSLCPAPTFLSFRHPPVFNATGVLANSCFYSLAALGKSTCSCSTWNITSTQTRDPGTALVSLVLCTASHKTSVGLWVCKTFNVSASSKPGLDFNFSVY
jgi:hypothetical protein